MAKLRKPFQLARDEKGLAMIEFALSLPIIAMLTFGAMDVSRMVINRLHLQQASAEVASLVIVKPPAGDSATELAYIKTAAAQASRLPADKIGATMSLLCDGEAAPDGATACAEGEEQERLFTLVLTGSYTPSWTKFGLGSTVNQVVTRVVRIQ